MGVHAGAVVTEDGFGHEGGGLAVLLADIANHVFVEHDLIAHLGERGVAHVDLGLPGRAHLVVMHLGMDAHFLELENDLGA